jgi:hypothetical protein
MAVQSPATVVDRFLQRNLRPDDYLRLRFFEACVVSLEGDKPRFFFAVVWGPFRRVGKKVTVDNRLFFFFL